MKKLSLILMGVVMSVTLAFANTPKTFPDVPAGQWFTEYVNTVSSWGVIKGNDDGTFAPARSLNRAEAAALFERYDKRVDEKLKALETRIATLEEKLQAQEEAMKEMEEKAGETTEETKEDDKKENETTSDNKTPETTTASNTTPETEVHQASNPGTGVEVLSMNVPAQNYVTQSEFDKKVKELEDAQAAHAQAQQHAQEQRNATTNASLTTMDQKVQSVNQNFAQLYVELAKKETTNAHLNYSNVAVKKFLSGIFNENFPVSCAEFDSTYIPFAAEALRQADTYVPGTSGKNTHITTTINTYKKHCLDLAL